MMNSNVYNSSPVKLQLFFFNSIYYRYGYEEEQYEGKFSNAIEMPETFGNTTSTSKDRSGSHSHHYSSSADSYRDKKYR